MNFPFFCLIYACLVSAFQTTIQGPDGSSLIPNTRTFETKNDLLKSKFWRYFVKGRSFITAKATVVFIKRDRLLIYLSRKTTGVSLPDGDISIVELLLGKKERIVGSRFYPLQTISAEYSTGSVLLETEAASGWVINLGSILQFTIGLGGTAKVYGTFEPGYTLSATLTESIICKANPGGVSQLQVSNTMRYFPEAKVREVNYTALSGKFKNGKWEAVQSTVGNEQYKGALFYSSGDVGRHRCVSDISLFEDSADRKWIEFDEAAPSSVLF